MSRNTRIAAALAGALIAQGCAAAPPAPEAVETARRNFIGDWTERSTRSARMEAQVESIGEDGRATGAACLRTARGTITGARLEDGNARVSDRRGHLMKVRFGKSHFTARALPGGTLTMIERRPVQQGGTERLETPMERAETLQCAHRFATEPVALDPEVSARAEGIIGYWTTGVTDNGNVLELAVLDVAPRGTEVRGLRCLASHTHHNVRLNDIGPEPDGPGPTPHER